MTEVSAFRLYLMRALYLLIAVGIGITIWPEVIHHPLTMHGATSSLLGTVGVLAVLGIRYPLQMLPLLFFEMVWKTIWLIAVALPLWSAHQIDAATAESVRGCLMGVIVPIVIPWRYVFANYVQKHGDRWGWRTASKEAAGHGGLRGTSR
ncbi:MAG TPA: hypothetical protein VII56_07980 [Rhizomicrobium sp.]